MNNKKTVVVFLAIFIFVGVATAVYGANFIGKNQAQNSQNCPYNGECVNDGICPNGQCPYQNTQSQISKNKTSTTNHQEKQVSNHNNGKYYTEEYLNYPNTNNKKHNNGQGSGQHTNLQKYHHQEHH
ncbi:MAG: hypothetical protein LBU74_01590 [Methanobacteriaceae archaeon]|jgi:hypothetical protein|nr:hypothetical protein [Candidatus Methanorudis spinitermitis]